MATISEQVVRLRELELTKADFLASKFGKGITRIPGKHPVIRRLDGEISVLTEVINARIAHERG